jgi:hypothetical protein
MACSVPSFLAAFTRASMPPKSVAEVAVAAFLPSAVDDALSGAAPQALRASAATTAREPPRTAFLGGDTVTVSPGVRTRVLSGTEKSRELVGRTCLNKLASVRPAMVSCS